MGTNHGMMVSVTITWDTMHVALHLEVNKEATPGRGYETYRQPQVQNDYQLSFPPTAL
jgi:hypothetical protein